MNRRDFLKLAAAVTLARPSFLGAQPASVPATAPSMRARKIPSSGEDVPVVGMGTWQTFDVRELDRQDQLKPLEEVLKVFFGAGGRLIDTAPMYRTAEEVTGILTERLGINRDVFLATKVMAEGRESGARQMEASLAKLRRRQRIELMQVHNLVDWRTQLATLREWKQAGRFKYIGVTHYAPGKFDELEQIVRDEKVDFIQLPYSVGVREVEKRLLPASKDNGVAVLVMRPLEGGNLFAKTRGRELPDAVKPWASSWAQAFLKFILAHDAVTAVLPATSKPHHMRDNVQAGHGRLPDAAERQALLSALGL
jgi:aryl-alcohol dehydrogenase-like predicted oxidoreductase